MDITERKQGASGNEAEWNVLALFFANVLDREMTVQELACGTGILSVRIAGSVKLLEATDFSEEMIRQAKAKAHSFRLHFSVQDATVLPYTSGTFDVVVISNALYIMPEPEKALAEEGYVFADACEIEHAVSSQSKEKNMVYDTVLSDYVCSTNPDNRAVEPGIRFSAGIFAVAFIP